MGQRPYVPDHKIYFTEFDSAEPAYYVCGLLNSALVREYIESHTIHIQVSNIFKHVSVPRFYRHKATHQRVVELCRKAHEAKSAGERAKLLTALATASDAVLKGAS
jgi:hypothetical protein